MPQPPLTTAALPSPSDFDHLPQRCREMSRSERLRALCGDQSLRWEGGRPVAVDRYLEAFPEVAADPREAMPLIVGEWLHRFDRGDLPRLSDYQRRFPHLADELARQFDLYLTLARSRATQAPGSGATPVDVAEPPAFAGYELLGELGRGGMGVVYKARQKSLDRLVAIKVVLHGVGARPEQLVRFRQEAELLARLTHPNVVQVFEAGAHAGHGYLVMEFIDGPSLAQHVGGQPQPPASAARLVESLARAVDHANRQGVIHRDIKPSNVLLTSAGVPKLTDFGLAKSLQAGDNGMTATGDVLGTPAYMAPEQARGQARQVGPATDVYGLGATLYELLTGRPPFEGATPLDVLLKVTSDDPSSVRSARPEVPADLETVCLKCLHKDPDKRYATAEALAEDLHRFLAGRPIAARPAGVAEKTWRWARRHPGVAGLLLAIFLSLSTGLAASTSLAVWALRSEEASERRREEAEGARRDTQRQLWETMLNEARGIRRSGRRGQRFDALAKLKEALALARQLGELSDEDRKRFRDEAAACLMLMDVEVAKQWPGWPAGSMNLAYDPEQRLYARQSAKDHSISIRRVADDRLIATLPGQGPVNGYGGLAFSPGGDWFARCAESSGLVEVWKLSGDGATKAWQVPGGSLVQFSPDGSLLAVASAGQTTRLFETATGRLRKHLAQGAVVFGDPFHPSKPHLALVRGQSVRVVDFTTGKVVAEADEPYGGCFAWHPSGRLFAFADPSNTIGLYDAATGEPALPPLQGHTSQGIVVTFAPTGEVLASTDWSGILRVWDVGSGRLLFSGMSPPVFGPVRFSPAPTLAGSHHAGQLSLLRLPATPVRTLASNIRVSPDHCALSPDGRRLACSDNLDTVVIDLPTATPLARPSPA
ncbi:MAG: serine/threonine-protein kinase [Gemmataceae bacterium]